MIIYYNKTTGKIIGSIEGRIHTDQHLNMWVGDKETTDRIVIQWIPAGDDFVPQSDQANIARLLDASPMKVREYKVDVKTKKLVKA